MGFTYRTGFFVVSAALAVSLVLHATRSSALGTPPPAGSSSASAPPACAAVEGSPTSRAIDAAIDPATCATELTRCREESWSVVAKAISSDREDHARAARGRAAASGPTATDPAETTTAADQRRVRCDIAEQQAREHWVNHRASIHASAKDIGKAAWQRTKIKKDVDDVAGLLGANGGERDRFERGFDGLWSKYGPLLERQLGTEPVDDAALLETVKAFWRDEDALIENVMGAAALAEYRASELRSRTAIAAVLAALADKPFDDALAW